MARLTEPQTSLSQEIVCLVVCHVVRGTPKKPKWLEELRRDRVEGWKVSVTLCTYRAFEAMVKGNYQEGLNVMCSCMF